MKRHQAFSIAEYVTSAPVALFALGSLVMIAFGFFGISTEAGAIADARARAEAVFDIARANAGMCGYGMPDGDAFRAAFYIGAREPFSWPGPASAGMNRISSAEFSDDRADGRCRLLRAVPSGARTASSADVYGHYFSVTLDSLPDYLPLEDFADKSLVNWLVFGAAAGGASPAMISSAAPNDDGTVTLMMRRLTDGRAFVPLGDEVCFIRGADMRVMPDISGGRVSDMIFCTDDLSGSGSQPRVPGIADARFELARDPGATPILRVWVMARGGARHTNAVTEGRPDGWPARWRANVPDEMRHYALYVFSTEVPIENLRLPSH